MSSRLAIRTILGRHASTASKLTVFILAWSPRWCGCFVAALARDVRRKHRGILYFCWLQRVWCKLACHTHLPDPIHSIGVPNECLIPITQLGCPFAKKREKDMKATHGPCEDNVIEPDHIICIFHGKICLVIVFHVICIRLIIFQSMFAILVIWISVAIHNIDKTCLPGWLSGQSLEGMPQQPASWQFSFWLGVRGDVGVL